MEASFRNFPRILPLKRKKSSWETWKMTQDLDLALKISGKMLQISYKVDTNAFVATDVMF